MAAIRMFNIVFGTWGDEPQVIQSNQEIWRARRGVMSLFRAEQKRCAEAGREDLAEFFATEAADMANREVGALVFGWVKRWKTPDGKTRFIGIIPPGSDYRSAGQMPVPDPSTRVPTKVPPMYPSTMPKPSRPTGIHMRQTMPSRPKAPVLTEAERIADRMAKASLDASREA